MICCDTEDSQGVVMPSDLRSTEDEVSSERFEEFVDTTSLNIQNDYCTDSREKMMSIQHREQTLDFHELDYMMAPGGGVSGFYEKDKLVCLKSYHGAETGGYGTDFYLTDDEVFAVLQYRDSYHDNGDYSWDTQRRTRAIDRTMYLEDGDSICSVGTAIGVEWHGLRTLEVAMQDFKKMKNELDKDRAR